MDRKRNIQNPKTTLFNGSPYILVHTIFISQTDYLNPIFYEVRTHSELDIQNA